MPKMWDWDSVVKVLLCILLLINIWEPQIICKTFNIYYSHVLILLLLSVLFCFCRVWTDLVYNHLLCCFFSCSWETSCCWVDILITFKHVSVLIFCFTKKNKSQWETVSKDGIRHTDRHQRIQDALHFICLGWFQFLWSSQERGRWVGRRLRAAMRRVKVKLKEGKIEKLNS